MFVERAGTLQAGGEYPAMSGTERRVRSKALDKAHDTLDGLGRRESV
jgi:hypothetical protein